MERKGNFMQEIKTDKLDIIVERFKTLDLKVQDPAVIADNKAWAELCKERSELEPIVEKYGELELVLHEDFSLLTAGSEAEPATNVKLTLDDSEAEYPWWNFDPKYTHEPTGA